MKPRRLGLALAGGLLSLAIGNFMATSLTMALGWAVGLGVFFGLVAGVLE